jgi:hypothetical protein
MISEPDFRKKLAEARWVQYKHINEAQKWRWGRAAAPSLSAVPNLQAGEGETIG